ncbi:hypothetical protein JTB14_026946 [Gonioctena quinquepunctata]|nr:hypothetical protein JTB14_026946 [Gonioctena quinquepunctata]
MQAVDGPSSADLEVPGPIGRDLTEKEAVDEPSNIDLAVAGPSGHIEKGCEYEVFFYEQNYESDDALGSSTFSRNRYVCRSLQLYSKFSLLSPDDEMVDSTPPEVCNLANEATKQLLPEKSKQKYDLAYDNFMAWKER